ncbi:MAG: hypothetical protein MMC33_003860 [Icmadophila ericetorum]|nr:hypothetical protein [Icmadophila ericetorum]
MEPTPELVQEFKDSRTEEKLSKAEAHQEQAAHAAANRIAQLDENDLLVQQLSTRPDGNRLPPPGERRMKAWDTIQKQQSKASYTFTISLEQQREVNRIVSDYRIHFGESPPAAGRSASPPDTSSPQSPLTEGMYDTFGPD